MAGIGQRFSSSDQNIPWNSQVQFNMGRALPSESSSLNKSYLNNFHSTLSEKRSTYPEENGESNMANNSVYLNSLNNRSGILPEKDMYYSAFSSVNLQQQINGDSSFPTSAADVRAGSLVGSTNNIPSSGLPQQRNSQFYNITPIHTGSYTNQFSTVTKTTNMRGLFGSGGGGGTGNGSGTTTPVNLDPSEFPTLSGRPGAVGSIGQHSHHGTTAVSAPLATAQLAGQISASNTTSLNYFNVFAKGPTQQMPEQNEFSIQQEDFPALPGTQNNALSNSMPDSFSTGQQQQMSYAAEQQQQAQICTLPPPSSQLLPSSMATQHNTAVSSSLPPTAVLPVGQSFPQSAPTASVASNYVQLLPNHVVSNIPRSMIRDHFGMLGLLKLMKVGETDATLNLLAPGVNLTSLGLSFDQADDIHPNFTSPWHETCMGRPQDMDCYVPPEYQIRHAISDSLADPQLDNLTDETLFWIFYNCTREESQLLAAQKLIQRDWRFHKKDQVWLTRAPDGDTVRLNNKSERGVYIVWDPATLMREERQMTLTYDDLDLSSSINPVGKELYFGLHNHHPKSNQLPAIPGGQVVGQSVSGQASQSSGVPLRSQQQHQQSQSSHQ